MDGGEGRNGEREEENGEEGEEEEAAFEVSIIPKDGQVLVDRKLLNGDFSFDCTDNGDVARIAFGLLILTLRKDGKVTNPLRPLSFLFTLVDFSILLDMMSSICLMYRSTRH